MTTENPEFERSFQKGRGAQHNPANKFLKGHFVPDLTAEGEGEEPVKTVFIPVFPKTIVNKVKSPDVGMEYSLNPYQGCEHGCIYCYARNSHEYWGYSAGVDFEQKVLVKQNAVELLTAHLANKNWQPAPIVLSGNTDCYQPAERKYQQTRKLLEVFLKYRHPVGIITKNALIQRDLDIIKELAAHSLIRVSISITSLDEDLRRLLEPRTASVKMRLKTVEALAAAGVPVNVMMAPIIPGLNSHEILPLVKTVAESGATSVGYTMVRLNGSIAEIFENWIRKAMPDRADKVLNQIAEVHGGKHNDSRWGTRMKGEGQLAAMVRDAMAMARKRYLPDVPRKELNRRLFVRPVVSANGQLSLFE